MFEKINKKIERSWIYTCDYLDRFTYFSDYLDYIDPDYIEKINSDDQYYLEVVKNRTYKSSFNDKTRA